MQIIDNVYDRCDEAMEKIFADFIAMDKTDPKYTDVEKMVIEMTKVILDAEKNDDTQANADNDRDLKLQQLEFEKEKHASDTELQTGKMKLENDKLEAENENEKYRRGSEDEKNRIEMERIDSEKKAAHGECIVKYAQLGFNALSLILTLLAHRSDLNAISELEEKKNIIPRTYCLKLMNWIKPNNK